MFHQNAPVSRPHPAAGQDKTLADVVREARIEAGFNSVRSFAEAVGAELGIPMETARSELTKIENDRRGVSDRYARAISRVAGVTLAQLREARGPSGPEQVAEALSDLVESISELHQKVDRLLAQRLDGDQPPG